MSAASISLILLGTNATAQSDTTVLNGAACNPSSSSEVSKIRYGVWGAGNESSTETANVTCAMPFNYLFQQSPPTQTFPPIFGFNAWVRDKSSTEDVSCQLRLLGQEGSVLYTETRSTFGGPYSAAIQLNWNSILASGYIQLTCSLPKYVVAGLLFNPSSVNSVAYWKAPE